MSRALGLQGIVRGRRVRTTTPDATAERPLDLVRRQFTAAKPNALWVADFTYVAMWRGFVYVAFVVDVFSRRIVGWRASASMRSDLVLDALEQALYDRETDAGLVCHSDHGVQYLSPRYTERLAAAGVEPSVGSQGDAYDCEYAGVALRPRLTPAYDRPRVLALICRRGRSASAAGREGVTR